MAQPLEHHLAGQIDRRPGFWHEVRARAVTGQVPTGVSSTVADLGAGGGQLAQILARDRPLARYRFHEPLDALSDVLVARHGEGARLGPHDELDVDLVALLDVIEHVEDDGRLVAQVVSRSRPGTTIVITVPAFAWLWSSWDEGLGHFRRYTKQQLSAVAEHLPLEISEVSYLFPELLVPALLRKAWRFVRRRPDEVAVDFVQLPGPVDGLARRIGMLTYRARRWMPFGTSVLLVARVRSTGGHLHD